MTCKPAPDWIKRASITKLIQWRDSGMTEKTRDWAQAELVKRRFYEEKETPPMPAPKVPETVAVILPLYADAAMCELNAKARLRVARNALAEATKRRRDIAADLKKLGYRPAKPKKES